MFPISEKRSFLFVKVTFYMSSLFHLCFFMLFESTFYFYLSKKSRFTPQRNDHGTLNKTVCEGLTIKSFDRCWP